MNVANAVETFVHGLYKISVCSRDIASVALTLSPLARAKAKRMNRDQGWLNFRIANQPDITQRGHAYQYQRSR